MTVHLFCYILQQAVLIDSSSFPRNWNLICGCIIPQLYAPEFSKCKKEGGRNLSSLHTEISVFSCYTGLIMRTIEKKNLWLVKKRSPQICLILLRKSISNILNLNNTKVIYILLLISIYLGKHQYKKCLKVLRHIMFFVFLCVFFFF